MLLFGEELINSWLLRCWGRDCTRPLTLTLPEGMDSFVVYCYTSISILGAVLMERRHAIAYGSRQLKPHKTNYPMLDLNLGVVVFAHKI